MRRMNATSYAWAAVAAMLLAVACDDGNDGRDGRDGTNGQAGKDGTNGKDGANGKDAVDPNALPLTKAVQALGGADALRAVKRLQYKATGQQFHTGQSIAPFGESIP